jgi:hypothetical protein
MNLFSQKIAFTYDENGNRSSRTKITTEQLQSKTIKFPVNEPLNLKTMENAKAAKTEELENDEIKAEEGEIITSVYPNPNKGILKIDVSNMPLNPENEMRLYDLSGMELIVKRNFESYSEIDISHLKSGIYILRIKINDKLVDWKIIKSNY